MNTNSTEFIFGNSCGENITIGVCTEKKNSNYCFDTIQIEVCHDDYGGAYVQAEKAYEAIKCLVEALSKRYLDPDTKEVDVATGDNFSRM